MDADEIVQQMSDRFEARQCVCCGAASGDEPLLPPGWSFVVFGESADPEMRGRVAAFFCSECARSMGFPEARNYAIDAHGEGLN